MKKIAFFDLDKTIFGGQTFFMFVKHEIDKGRVDVNTWEAIESLLNDYKSSAISYKEAADQMLIIFASALRGTRYDELLKDAEEFFEQNSEKFYTYFVDLHTKLAETHDIYIVTTNIEFIAKAVVKRFRLAGHISTQYGVVEGIFNGEVEKSLAGNKHVVAELLNEYGVEGSLAFGDSENDIEMLELVETPICVDPNDRLIEAANERGWIKTSNQEAERYILRA